MKISKLLGGIAIISGTAIGGGMLAIPADTAAGGAIPAFFTLLICWVFMTVGALYILEVNLWFKDEADLITMANNTLGNVGKGVVWGTYLAMLYALISLYLTGTAGWTNKLLTEYFQYNINDKITYVLIAIITSFILIKGTAWVDKINRALALLFILSFSILITATMPDIKLNNLQIGDINTVLPNFPLIITAFGCGIVIPALTNYFNREDLALEKIVIIGSLIPLIVYVLWVLATLGVLPLKGANSVQSLALGSKDGTEVSTALELFTNNSIITYSIRVFSIFAILTSLLGVSLGLYHFLADGLNLTLTKIKDKITLIAISFIPPLAIVIWYPAGFGRILSFAGLLVAVLLGIVPALMAFRGRYSLNLNTEKHFKVPGGKFLILLTLIFFGFIVYQEILNTIQVLLN